MRGLLHAREGTSTALAVFDRVPAALQSAVRSAQLQKARERTAHCDRHLLVLYPGR